MPRPGSTDRAAAGERHGPLDLDRIRTLLACLEARAGTWKGRRIYTLTSIIVYTGLFPSEVFRLTREDFVLTGEGFAGGMIRVPTRREPTSIDPELAEILDAWWPIRTRGKPDPSGNLRYGEKLAEDGKTRIPDDAERAVIADMLRLRSEGLSLQRIASDLDARKVPTKSRKARWSAGSVHTILKKIGRPGPDEVDSTGEGEGGSEVEPDWLFPNIREKGHWSGSTFAGYRPLDQLQQAGKAAGIEGVTFDRLMRSHREMTRPTPPPRPIVSLWGDKASPRPDAPPPSAAGPIRAPQAPATDGDASVDQAASISQAEPQATPKPGPTWPTGRCPVAFGADGSPIAGQPKKVTVPQWKVIRALVDAGPAGLTGEELVEKSGHTGYRHILETLARDEDWRSRIRGAGDRHGHYRLAMPGDK